MQKPARNTSMKNDQAKSKGEGVEENYFFKDQDGHPAVTIRAKSLEEAHEKYNDMFNS